MYHLKESGFLLFGPYINISRELKLWTKSSFCMQNQMVYKIHQWKKMYISYLYLILNLGNSRKEFPFPIPCTAFSISICRTGLRSRGYLLSMLMKLDSKIYLYITNYKKIFFFLILGCINVYTVHCVMYTWNNEKKRTLPQCWWQDSIKVDSLRKI